MFEVAPACGIGFLERLLLLLELRRWQRRNIDVFQKLLADRAANAPCIQTEPFAIMFLKLVHFARQDAALKAVHRAVLSIDLVNALVAHRSLEFMERHLGAA